MRILARYISSLFVKNFLMASIGLTVLILFQATLAQLLDSEFPAYQVLFYQLLKVPRVFVQMSPPSVLLATVLTLSTMNRSHELVACYSLGVGLEQIAGIIFAIVFMICCFNLVLQDRILPPVYKKEKTYYAREMKKRMNFYFDSKRNKIWYRSKNYIYNIQSYDPATREISGLTVYKFSPKFELVETLNAEKAVFSDQGWVLERGLTTRFNVDPEGFPVVSEYKGKPLKINETPQDFNEIGQRVNSLRLRQLYRYIKTLKKTGIRSEKSEVAFHSRMSLSFIPLVMAFLGFPFATRSMREGGLGRDLGVCLAITFFYWIFYSIGLSLGVKGALSLWLAAWLPSLIFVVLAAALVFRSRRRA